MEGIFDETNSFGRALFFSNEGVLTFQDFPNFLQFKLPTEDASQESLVVVSRFFDHNVLFPSPNTFKEALDIKEDKLIIEWRTWMLDLSRKLVSNEIGWAEVNKELNKTNEIIEKSNYPKRILPRWVSSAAYTGSVLSLMPGLQAIGFACLVIDTLKMAGDANEQLAKYRYGKESKLLIVSNTK